MPQLPRDRGYMGDPKRGASLGRANQGAATPDAVKFKLQKVRIDSQGYDDGGAYWGIGQGVCLYWAHAEFVTPGRTYPIDRFFWEPGRAAAKEHMRKEFPKATFYR